jgi:hypothetical protein
VSEHDHDHPHAPVTDGDEPAAAARARALEELLVSKGVVRREDVRRMIDWLVSRTPATAPGSSRVHGWIRSSRSACSGTRVRRLSSSVSTQGRRLS